MDELWESYGPNGNNQMQILSIEVYDNSDEIVEETTNIWGINNPIINLNPGFENRMNKFFNIQKVRYTGIIDRIPAKILLLIFPFILLPFKSFI